MFHLRDDEHLRQISWKSDLHFREITTRVFTNERNEPTYQQTRVITVALRGSNNPALKRNTLQVVSVELD